MGPVHAALIVWYPWHPLGKEGFPLRRRQWLGIPHQTPSSACRQTRWPHTGSCALKTISIVRLISYERASNWETHSATALSLNPSRLGRNAMHSPSALHVFLASNLASMRVRHLPLPVPLCKCKPGRWVWPVGALGPRRAPDTEEASTVCVVSSPVVSPIGLKVAIPFHR